MEGKLQILLNKDRYFEIGSFPWDFKGSVREEIESMMPYEVDRTFPQCWAGPKRLIEYVEGVFRMFGAEVVRTEDWI